MRNMKKYFDQGMEIMSDRRTAGLTAKECRAIVESAISEGDTSVASMIFYAFTVGFAAGFKEGNKIIIKR